MDICDYLLIFLYICIYYKNDFERIEFCELFRNIIFLYMYVKFDLWYFWNFFVYDIVFFDEDVLF